jgi:hypothetical protein
MIIIIIPNKTLEQLKLELITRHFHKWNQRNVKYDVMFIIIIMFTYYSTVFCRSQKRKKSIKNICSSFVIVLWGSRWFNTLLQASYSIWILLLAGAWAFGTMMERIPSFRLALTAS